MTFFFLPSFHSNVKEISFARIFTYMWMNFSCFASFTHDDEAEAAVVVASRSIYWWLLFLLWIYHRHHLMLSILSGTLHTAKASKLLFLAFDINKSGRNEIKIYDDYQYIEQHSFAFSFIFMMIDFFLSIFIYSWILALCFRQPITRRDVLCFFSSSYTLMRFKVMLACMLVTWQCVKLFSFKSWMKREGGINFVQRKLFKKEIDKSFQVLFLKD